MIICYIVCLFLGFSTVLASVNLSINRSATQSSTFSNTQGNLSAGRAVDGKYDTVKDTLSCAVTEARDKMVFWQVMLRETSIISHIHFVFESTKEIAAILRNHRVYISNNSHVVSGRECYRETRNNPGLINEVYCHDVGRYVTYYSNHPYNGKVALSLICEVEVYGCPVGFYGFLCQSRCSSNCMSQPCEPDFGNCIGSCKPGFVGDRCEQVCATGFYGANCALRCSSTCRNNSCNNINGTCGQCEAGFAGDMCGISITSTTPTSTVPSANNPGTGETQMNQINERDMKYIIIIGVLSIVLILFIIIVCCLRSKSRKMERMLDEKSAIYHNPDDNPKFHNPALGMSRLKNNTNNTKSSTLIYDSPDINYDGKHYYDAKSKEATLHYANSKSTTDPALDYEALQRDGIYPRESKHLYDPIHS